VFQKSFGAFFTISSLLFLASFGTYNGKRCPNFGDLDYPGHQKASISFPLLKKGSTIHFPLFQSVPNLLKHHCNLEEASASAQGILSPTPGGFHVFSYFHGFVNLVKINLNE